MTFRYYTYEILLIFTVCVKCTIDINKSEFQYLANHLHDEECRRLVAALHFDSFESPNALEEAEKKVSKDIPCLQQLLHWNSEKRGGRTESHELVSRRLRQIGRDDLAKWLTTSSYEALGHNFQRSIRDTVKLYEPIHLPSLYITTEAPEPSPLLKLSSNSWQFTLQRIKNCCESSTRKCNKQNEKARAYGHKAFCKSHSQIHNQQNEKYCQLHSQTHKQYETTRNYEHDHKAFCKSHSQTQKTEKPFCQLHSQIHYKQNEKSRNYGHKASHLQIHNKQNEYGHKLDLHNQQNEDGHKLDLHNQQNEYGHKLDLHNQQNEDGHKLDLHNQQNEDGHKLDFHNKQNEYGHKVDLQLHNTQNEYGHKLDLHNKQNEYGHKVDFQLHNTQNEYGNKLHLLNQQNEYGHKLDLNHQQNEYGHKLNLHNKQNEEALYLSNSQIQSKTEKEYGFKSYYQSLFGDRTHSRSRLKQTFFRQENAPVTITPDELVDLTEWTIFDTISWTIVTLLFLLVIVLLVYLTITSPCWKHKKRRCTPVCIYDSESSCPCHQRPKCCRCKKKKKSCVCMEPSRRTICACPVMADCPQAVYCTNQTPLPPPKPKSENGYSTGLSNSTTYSTVRYM